MITISTKKGEKEFKGFREIEGVKDSQHRCIDCGKKLKPVVLWRIRCPKHLERANLSRC